jgi:hypothetical protein
MEVRRNHHLNSLLFELVHHFLRVRPTKGVVVCLVTASAGLVHYYSVTAHHSGWFTIIEEHKPKSHPAASAAAQCTRSGCAEQECPMNSFTPH